MKRFLPLFLIVLSFVSCTEDVQFNTPGFQGLKDNVMWHSTDTRAYVSPTGTLKIEALSSYEKVTLNTASPNVGTYILGTTNINNSAAYSFKSADVDLQYATVAIAGPVSSINLISGGLGYAGSTSVATSGGSGSGLTVNTTVNSKGTVTSAVLSSRGNGYKAGDILTVVGGNNQCKIQVVNVLNSNGEILITEYDNVNMTVSGKFRFNAANVNDNPLGGPVLNFQYGEFYKIPIYPNP